MDFLRSLGHISGGHLGHLLFWRLGGQGGMVAPGVEEDVRFAGTGIPGRLRHLLYSE